MRRLFSVFAVVLLCAASAAGQTSVSLAPVAKQQFFGANGQPLSGGKLYTYAAGTTTRQDTYTESTGTTPHSFPIVMDAGGMLPTGTALFLNTAVCYKFVMQNSAGVQQWSVDNICSPDAGTLTDFLTNLATIGYRVPGTAAGTVADPATAPTVATDTTSGGSLDNTTRYIRVGLLTLNGETLPSPVQSFTPSTCGGAACKLSVNVAGQEWYQGAIAYRVYACTDSAGGTCYRQTGFPDEIDTTGALGNAHYTPGTVILSTITLSGTSPPASNTATIDADQVALNAACFSNTNQCAGTLQYKANPTSSTVAQTGTTPLLLARAGTRVRGHGSESVDITSHGSTRSCAFTSLPSGTQVKVGCVHVHNVNGVDVEGLNVAATSTAAVFLNTSGSSFNLVQWRNSVLSATGSNAIGVLRIQGIWYYLDFANNLLYANLSGTGGSKGAAVLYSNASGANHKFSGKSRWTVNNHADAVRNNLGKTDRDRATSATFPTMVGDVVFEDVQVQWSPPGGSPQGVLIKGGGLSFTLNRFTHSDYSVSAGAGPLIEFGNDADGSAACCQHASILNSSSIGAEADNSAWFQIITGTTATTIQSIRVEGATPGIIDLNSINVPLFVKNVPLIGQFNCGSFVGSGARIINPTATHPITCEYGVNNGSSTMRVSNYRFTGGMGLYSDAAANTNSRQFFWSATNTLGLYEGDPTTAANELVAFIGGKRTCWRNFSASACALDIDSRTGVDVIHVANPFRPSVTATTPLGGASNRWAGVWSTTGNFDGHVIFATDNTYDFGASGATRPRTGYFGTSLVAPTFTNSQHVLVQGAVSPSDGVAGGNVSITAGNALTGAGSGAGGSVSITAGQSDDSTAGDVTIVTQTGVSSGAGNVSVTPATNGNISLTVAGTGVVSLNGKAGTGTAFKMASVTTGSISASSSAAVTVTFSGVFSSATWIPVCSVLEATTSTNTLRVHHIESITNTTNATAVVRVVNDDGGSAHTGTLYCFGGVA